MIGIDIVDISRIADAVEKYGDRFLDKIFTEEEIAYVKKGKRLNESLAGRFAAKEAFMKAHGEKLPWKDINVTQAGGRPCIRYRGVLYGDVSISHERAYAVAVVVLK